MSGPTYPRIPYIFDLYSGQVHEIDYWDTVNSQYANSPILTNIIADCNAYFDPRPNLDSFYDNIWNLNSAQGYGLDVWGRIVGVERQLKVQISFWFGFQEALPFSLPFNTDLFPDFTAPLGFQEGTNYATWATGSFVPGEYWTSSGGFQGGGAFWNGERLTNIETLPDSTYRLLIYAKARFNICNGSIPAINQILMNVFPNRGKCYVQEGYHGLAFFGFQEQHNVGTFGQDPFYSNEYISSMTMQYVFDFAITPLEYAIVALSGAIPKPAGVLATVVVNYPPVL